MRRVVVTGLGIVSSIGNNAQEVLAAESRDIRHRRQRGNGRARLSQPGRGHAETGCRRTRRQAHAALHGAGRGLCPYRDGPGDRGCGLEESDIVNPRTGLVAGSGGPSTSAMLAAHQTVLETGATKRIGPFAVPKCMCSTISANLATAYKIKGINYSITSACSTSLHCIGNAAEQIMMGKQDVMFAGGGEELDWTLSCLFDAMGAMSSKFNDTPERPHAPLTPTATAS